MADTNPSLESRIGNPRDPGAVDNRLSLDPNDPNWKNAIAGWEDGEEYTVKLKVTQISPGEYEVTALSSSDAGESETESETEDAGEDGEEEDMPMESKPKVRKAVRQMMMQEGM